MEAMRAKPASPLGEKHLFENQTVKLGEKVSEQHFDEHECLTVHLLDRDEVFRHMNDGSMVQSLMLAPLWRYFSELNWDCSGGGITGKRGHEA